MCAAVEAQHLFLGHVDIVSEIIFFSSYDSVFLDHYKKQTFKNQMQKHRFYEVHFTVQNTNCYYVDMYIAQLLDRLFRIFSQRWHKKHFALFPPCLRHWVTIIRVMINGALCTCYSCLQRLTSVINAYNTMNHSGVWMITGL